MLPATTAGDQEDLPLPQQFLVPRKAGPDEDREMAAAADAAAAVVVAVAAAAVVVAVAVAVVVVVVVGGEGSYLLCASLITITASMSGHVQTPGNSFSCRGDVKECRCKSWMGPPYGSKTG